MILIYWNFSLKTEHKFWTLEKKIHNFSMEP